MISAMRRPLINAGVSVAWLALLAAAAAFLSADATGGSGTLSALFGVLCILATVAVPVADPAVRRGVARVARRMYGRRLPTERHGLRPGRPGVRDHASGRPRSFTWPAVPRRSVRPPVVGRRRGVG
jgi:hypothetical protein